jgi:hypothetical protein
MNYVDLLVWSVLKPFIIGSLMLIAFVLLFWMPKAALAVFVAIGVFSIIAKLAGWLEKP